MELGRARDLTGTRFGKLVAINLALKSRNGTAKWLCKCDCGNEKILFSTALRRGGLISCGCDLGERISKARTTHGITGSRTYNSWKSMKGRCSNPSNPDFKYYGGRGIGICAAWKESFENFLKDMGDRPANTSLDRIDNDLDYELNNCRWATPKEQANNRRPVIASVRGF